MGSPRASSATGAPVRTARGSWPHGRWYCGSPIIRITGSTESGVLDRSPWANGVRAKRPSGSSRKTPNPAQVRSSRRVASGSDPTFTATASAVCGPAASTSAMPSFAAA